MPLGRELFWSSVPWQGSSEQKEKCIYKVVLGLWLHVVFDPRYCCDSTHWSCRDKEAEGPASQGSSTVYTPKTPSPALTQPSAMMV